MMVDSAISQISKQNLASIPEDGAALNSDQIDRSIDNDICDADDEKCKQNQRVDIPTIPKEDKNEESPRKIQPLGKFDKKPRPKEPDADQRPLFDKSLPVPPIDQAKPVKDTNANDKKDKSNVKFDPGVHKIAPVESSSEMDFKIIHKMIEHAFTTFSSCCVESDFLENGHGYNVYKHPMSLTAIDGLDTLLLYHYVKNSKESEDLLNKIYKSVLKSKLINDQSVSMFEMNIRITGGLLGAVHIVDFLDLPNFDKTALIEKAAEFVSLNIDKYSNSNGVPYAYMNLKTEERGYQTWIQYAFLSEVGSHQLEFKSLEHMVADNSKYSKIRFSSYSDKVFKDLLSQSDELFPSCIDKQTGKLVASSAVTLGAFADSFYEYILKMYILTGEELYKTKFIQVAKYIKRDLIQEYTIDKEKVYLLKSSDSNGFDHLTCFAGGMFALASTVIPEHAMEYMDIGRKLTHGCWAIYQVFPTGLGPDLCSPSINKDNEFTCSLNPASVDGQFKLRPELVESIYYLYRITKEEKYKEWNYKIANSIEHFCKTEFGYVDVHVRTKEQGSRQDSWFVAETLKYLLLTFELEDLVPLKDFVFNTEAHPLRINK